MGDPIEDLRRACELIRASTGERDPRYIVMSESVYERIRAMLAEQRAGRRARRHRPGIDS